MSKAKFATKITAVALIALAFSIAAPARQAFAAGEMALLRKSAAPPNGFWLDQIDASALKQTVGINNPGRTNEGFPIMLRGATFQHGLSLRGGGVIALDLKGDAEKFMALVGADDARMGKGAISFQVWVDGKSVVVTPFFKGGDKPQLISVDLTGAKRLALLADCRSGSPDEDHADWAGALLIMKAGATAKPALMTVVDEPAPPIAHGDAPEPRINGPRVYGATPGKPFLFLIPATGKKPLTFSAENLPAGLTLDTKTGIISGSLKKDGETVVTLKVQGPAGAASRKLTIIGGKSKLAQTPQLGWNSWNVWGLAVDSDKTIAAAKSMVDSGLAAHGFSYVNIDDGWEAEERAANGEIVTNKKFPDMKKLTDTVHSMGLKLGIYSSPGPRTCGGYLGSYEHEAQDAETYAKWGIDYLKYDWCSYGAYAKDHSIAELQKPYIIMRDALLNSSRDIFYSLCQYGMGNVWEWGAEVGGNSWRTTGDINDSWGSLDSIGFSQNGHEKFAGPGHWNDPDMLVVGKVGWGPTLHMTKLTKNEQILHITLWSMVSSPLLIGCDMTDMDQFTLDLLTNDEVLDVHQDPLGKPAGRVAKNGMFEVWARPQWDGTTAVALFNRFVERAEITVNWSDIGMSGSQQVRDLWQRKDLGSFDGSFTVSVPAHGAVMLKIGKPKGE